MLQRMCDNDPDALRLLREVVKSQGERTDLGDNITEDDTETGTSKDYTLDRLARERPADVGGVDGAAVGTGALILTVRIAQ